MFRIAERGVVLIAMIRKQEVQERVLLATTLKPKMGQG
jgi:hypothetical protein